MKTINLLLAGADRRLNNLIEAAVRDACFGQAIAECACCSRLDELAQQGGTGWPDLIVAAPGYLLPPANRRGSQASLEQVAGAIRAIQVRRPIPMLAINVAAEDHMALLEAGVENVFGFPLDLDLLKSEVRRVLRLSEPVEASEPASSRSLGGLLLRGWQRLRHAA